MKKEILVLFLLLVFLCLVWFKLIGGDPKKKKHPYPNMKYVLLWTKSYPIPFVYMGKGQNTFLKRRCPVSNCYITSKRRFLNNLENFDAILFFGPELGQENVALPKKRSPHQKYIFLSGESSVNHPLQDKKYESFFNWTWTYKLNSELYYGYMIIKNKQGDIIGPKEVMHWLKAEEMEPISHELKDKLKSKKIAAAWFVSNCQARSGRDKLAKELQQKLAKHNMTLDIYGACGTKQCSKDNTVECLRKMERDYYFYLSFENSFSEDYVTEKLRNPLKYYTVPIVYGGANYTRFIPDGSYLNARTLTLNELIKKMVDAINNKDEYYNFFRWKNHYSYHKAEETPESDYYCRFCSTINDENLFKKISVYDNFYSWWHGKEKFLTALPVQTKFDYSKENKSKSINLLR